MITITRRDTIALAGAGVLATAFTPPATASSSTQAAGDGNVMSTETIARFAYVGCRTTRERNARGDGLSVYSIDSKTGAWTLAQLVKDLVNPSFLIIEPKRACLYVVHGDVSDVSAFKIDKQNGQIGFLNRQSTKGSNPVHLVVDPTGQNLVLANYATGSVATLPIRDDGSLGEVVDLISLPGTPGPHKIEQKSSHPHETAMGPDRRYVVVPDKGLDRIFVLKFDPVTGRPAPNDTFFVETREGAGPRHIVFAANRPFAYVVNELDSTVATYAWNAEKGTLRPLQILPSIPADFTGNNRAAEIALSPDGRHIYVSNRGHDSIGHFTVDASTGWLTPASWTSAHGKGPRFFTLELDGKALWVANELSDTLEEFAIDAETGYLRHSGQSIATGSPVCIVFGTG